MKQPPIFKTGDPSYFVAASTSGSASPTVLTNSNGSPGACFVGLRFIERTVFPLTRRDSSGRDNVGAPPDVTVLSRLPGTGDLWGQYLVVCQCGQMSRSR